MGTQPTGQGSGRRAPASLPTKALTIHQPWASLITAGIKDVENRRWVTGHRGPLWIHAGKATDHSRPAVEARRLMGEPDLPAGAVIGWVTVSDVVVRHETSPWAEDGYWHWVLTDPHPLPEPIPYRGAQGLWNLNWDTLHKA